MSIFSLAKADKKRCVAAAVAGLVSLIFAAASQAQPIGGKLMTDITIHKDNGCEMLRVSFSLPVRYVNHFPIDEGSELRIQLKPVTTDPADAQAVLKREAFSPVDKSTPLTNVIYEGDVENGPQLSLQFNRSMHFTVAQGDDFRSINVSFSDAADMAAVCPKASPSEPPAPQ